MVPAPQLRPKEELLNRVHIPAKAVLCARRRGQVTRKRARDTGQQLQQQRRKLEDALIQDLSVSSTEGSFSGCSGAIPWPYDG